MIRKSRLQEEGHEVGKLVAITVEIAGRCCNGDRCWKEGEHDKEIMERMILFFSPLLPQSFDCDVVRGFFAVNPFSSGTPFYHEFECD